MSLLSLENHHHTTSAMHTGCVVCGANAYPNICNSKAIHVSATVSTEEAGFSHCSTCVLDADIMFRAFSLNGF